MHRWWIIRCSTIGWSSDLTSGTSWCCLEWSKKCWLWTCQSQGPGIFVFSNNLQKAPRTERLWIAKERSPNRHLSSRWPHIAIWHISSAWPLTDQLNSWQSFWRQTFNCLNFPWDLTRCEFSFTKQRPFSATPFWGSTSSDHKTANFDGRSMGQVGHQPAGYALARTWRSKPNRLETFQRRGPHKMA